jgi:hypothetical protein
MAGHFGLQSRPRRAGIAERAIAILLPLVAVGAMLMALEP